LAAFSLTTSILGNDFVIFYRDRTKAFPPSALSGITVSCKLLVAILHAFFSTTTKFYQHKIVKEAKM
jgi:hypothetical protein